MIKADKTDIIRFDKYSESFGTMFFEKEKLKTKCYQPIKDLYANWKF